MTIEELTLIFNMLGISGGAFLATFILFKFAIPLFKRLFVLFNTWESFIRDWAGTPEEPGRSRVPGVMERLNEIDGALKNNGGSSVKDAIDRIERKLGKIDTRLADGDKKFEDIYDHIKNIEKDI